MSPERGYFSEERLEPGKCKKCGFEYRQHAIVTPEEVEFLRSLGYGVFICKDIEDNPFLEGRHLEIVASKDDVFLETDEIEKMYNARGPDDPCDSAFMREISS